MANNIGYWHWLIIKMVCRAAKTVYKDRTEILQTVLTNYSIETIKTMRRHELCLWII